MTSWKLSADTVKALDAAHAAIDAELTELRSEFDDKSDAWREGDRGSGVDAWLEELERLRDDLDAYEHAPA
jgi:hypothetical protein